jgi:hypothetical protein
VDPLRAAGVSQPRTGEFQVRGLDYEYTDAVKIVKLMNFSLEKMQRVALLQLSVVSETLVF